MQTIPLELLIDHEMAYLAFSSTREETPCCNFLWCRELPQSREVNRALRLRDDGRGADAVARSVIGAFRSQGIRATVEIDAVSEAQGIGFALRRLGVTPVIGSRSLMSIPASVALPSLDPAGSISAREIDRNAHGQMAAWLDTNLHDVESYGDVSMWRTLATREAMSAAIRLFLGHWQGEPATTCSLYCAADMARIEMVETRETLRRRGIAGAVVSEAVRQARQAGAQTVYLVTDTDSDAERLYTKLGFVREGVNVLRRHIETD